jgi:hypothetical protein
MILCQPTEPFWRVAPPEGLTENPLGYACAPNAADASYAGARRIEEFIAYGFATCWFSPDDFTLWWRLERHDIQWLRETFLEVLEHVLLSWWEDGDEWELPVRHFDWGDYGATINIGNSDEGEEEEVMLTWAPSVFDARPEPDTANVIALDLACQVAASAVPGAHGGEPLTIFLDPCAIQDRARVRCAIAWARQMNALPGVEGEDRRTAERWAALGVPEVEPPEVADCFAIGDSWERRDEDV